MNESRAQKAAQRVGLAEALANVLLASARLSFPCYKYQSDPVGFAREVLGVEPWSKQEEVLEAIKEPLARVAVASGHKIGKSNIAAIAGIWFYSCFDDARVVMSSTTSRQVDRILWREVRMLHTRSREAIPGELHELARSGLIAPDFREIVGFTAKEAEAVAGISGPNLFYILDEASGIPEVIFQAIEGNRAGGARLLMTSNPTRTEGEFFEAFHGKSSFYKTIQVSSEDSPNAREGRIVIPGLATREWIEEKKLEWGEESPLYKVRVKGEFVTREDGKIISLHAIGEAEARHEDTPEEGRLQLGLDPAGPGDAGDETTFAPRRGLKVISVLAMRGLSEEAIIVNARALLKQYRRPGERPVIVVDREGPIGSALYGRLRAISETIQDPMKAFDVVGVRASDRARRDPQLYDRVRDELWANLAEWLRDGGAIPEDAKLSAELHAPEWEQHFNGRLKVTPKEVLRKALGRSPDRADAVALAAYEPRGLEERVIESTTTKQPPLYEGPALDPYSGLNIWQR